MALTATHNSVPFGIGDLVKVSQRIKEGEKSRVQIFEGQILAIKNREENKSITVRRIGANLIGVERIFPLMSPTIEKIEVVKAGTSGARHAKLYYTRDKSKREVDTIYARTKRRVRVFEEQKEATTKNAKTAKKATKKTAKKAKPQE
jgi:large subunit ribosomal protein L19